MTAQRWYSCCLWSLVAILLIVALIMSAGCGVVACSTGERDLKIPYAYAAAYVIVTSELPTQEPKVSAQTPRAVDTEAATKATKAFVDKALGWTFKETPAARDGNAATPNIEAKEIAPPAAIPEPPSVVVYGTANCEACKWLTKKLTEAGVKHSYVILGNNEVKENPGQAYPYGLINGEPADYEELQTLLEK